MILFAALGMLIWWGSLRWRRTVRGFAWTVAGAALPLLFVWMQRKIEAMAGADWFRIEFQLQMYSYAALLLVAGLFIVSLPRRGMGERGASRPCGHCGYELRGLVSSDAHARCPECGEVNDPRGTMAEAQRVRFAEARRRLRLMERGIDPDSDFGSAADDADQQPETDDAHRRAQGEQQAERAQQLA